MSLEDLIRREARGLIQRAIEIEVGELLAEYENVQMLAGQRAVVRNGYLPKREVLTAVGAVEVRAPKYGTAPAEVSSSTGRYYRPTCGAPGA
jgi:putative transposase